VDRSSGLNEAFAWRAVRACGTDGGKRSAAARFPSREPDSRARHPSRTNFHWSLPRLPSGAATEDAIALVPWPVTVDMRSGEWKGRWLERTALKNN
jgi:hypothetical protein